MRGLNLRMHTRDRRAGFSLLELLIASAVMGFVVMYLMQSFSTSQKAYVVVEQVSEAQQNLRVVADLIERDLRLAGYLVPKHAAVCGVDSTNGADTLFISNADVILPADQLQVANLQALLSGELFGPMTGPGTTVAGVVGGGGMVLNVTRRWLDVLANGTDFAQGAGVIVVDLNDTSGRSTCGVITNVNPGAGDTAQITADFVSPNLGPHGANPNIVAVPAHVYQITPPNAGTGTPAQLYRDGVLLANDVEDMQFGLFFDLNDDRIIDPGEYQGDDGTAVGDGNPVAYDPSLTDGRMLRQIQINLVTSTRDDDPNEDAPMMIQQATGNRNPATLPAADQKRRRVYTSTVRMRNV